MAIHNGMELLYHPSSAGGMSATIERHTQLLGPEVIIENDNGNQSFCMKEKKDIIEYIAQSKLLEPFLNHINWWTDTPPHKITPEDIKLVASEIENNTDRDAFMERIQAIQEAVKIDEAQLSQLDEAAQKAFRASGKGEPFENRVSPFSANRTKAKITLFEQAAGFRLFAYENPFFAEAERILGARTLALARTSQAFYLEETTDGMLFRFPKAIGSGETINAEQPIRDFGKTILGSNYQIIAGRVSELLAVITKKKRMGRDHLDNIFPEDVKITESEVRAAKVMSELSLEIFRLMPMHKILTAGNYEPDANFFKGLVDDLGYTKAADFKTPGTFFEAPRTTDDKRNNTSTFYIFPHHLEFPIKISAKNQRISNIQPIDVETGLPFLDDPAQECLYDHTIADIPAFIAKFEAFGYKEATSIQKGCIVKQADHITVWSMFAEHPITVYYDEPIVKDPQILTIKKDSAKPNRRSLFTRAKKDPNSEFIQTHKGATITDLLAELSEAKYVPGEEVQEGTYKQTKNHITLWLKNSEAPIKFYITQPSIKSSDVLDPQTGNVLKDYDKTTLFNYSSLLTGDNELTWDRLATSQAAGRSVIFFEKGYMPGHEASMIDSATMERIKSLIAEVEKPINHGPIEFLSEVMLARFMGDRCYKIWQELQAAESKLSTEQMDVSNTVKPFDINRGAPLRNPFLEIRKSRLPSTDPKYAELYSVEANPNPGSKTRMFTT